MVRLTFAKVANRWKGIFCESPVSREFDIRRATTMARIVQGSVLRTLTGALVAWAAASLGAGQAASIAFGSDSPRIEIDLARGTPREQLAKQTLEQVLASHDLSKYTFTRKVVIEQGAINHAFPILTLNAVLRLVT